MSKKIITVGDGQTIWDIVAQEYGSVDGLEQLCNDNPGTVSLRTPLVTGQLIVIDDTKVIDQAVVDYFAARVLKPATSNGSIGNISFSNGFSNGFN